MGMISCPALKQSPASQKKLVEVLAPKTEGPPQLPEQQRSHDHGYARHRRHSSGGIPDQPIPDPPAQSTILSTSPNLPKPVLPFVAPPLLASWSRTSTSNTTAAIDPAIHANPSMQPPIASGPPTLVSSMLAAMPPMPLALPPEIQQRAELPPPSFTPRLSLPLAAVAPHNFTPQTSREGALAGGTLLSTGSSRLSGIERRLSYGSIPDITMPLPVGLIAPQGSGGISPPNVSSTPYTQPATNMGQCGGGLASRSEDAKAEGREVAETCVQAEDREISDHAAPLSRSNSQSTLSNATDEEIDQFVPQNYLQSWEFPLSQSEKRLLYTRLCDQERAAAVQECRHLKRRVSTASRRASMAASCDGKTSRRVSIADTQYGSDEDDDCCNHQEDRLLVKERELERQLESVRTERKRLSLSRP